MSAPKKTQAGARKKPLAFWRDRRGAAAVEFAFIAPVLIIMYCGLAELSQAMMAQHRVIDPLVEAEDRPVGVLERIVEVPRRR